MEVQPLTCPACDGPVPLVDADVATCPYCGKPVPISESLRQLRRGLAKFSDEQRAAEGLYRRLGKPPPRFLRAFSFFDSVWFWGVAFGFWVTAGLFVFSFSVPWVGEHLLHVNTWDVLTDQQGSMISIGGTLGSVALGLLLSGWSRKRVVSRGSLQAALSAAPPRSAGGPAQCRRCGAALAVPGGALGARCDYCRADNLVQIPPDWVAKVRRMVKSAAHEERALLAAEAAARRSLRWSLFWRLIIGALLVVPVVGLIGAGSPRVTDASSVNLYGDASFLPTWTRAQVPDWKCTGAGPWYPTRFGHCSNGHCESVELVALSAGKPFRVTLSDVQAPLEVSLEVRHMALLEAYWVPVARATASNGAVTLVPPLTGWYRVRMIGPDPAVTLQLCRSQG